MCNHTVAQPATSRRQSNLLSESQATAYPCRFVIYGATGRELVPVLKETGLLLLVYGVALGITLSLA